MESLPNPPTEETIVSPAKPEHLVSEALKKSSVFDKVLEDIQAEEENNG